MERVVVFVVLIFESRGEISSFVDGPTSLGSYSSSSSYDEEVGFHLIVGIDIGQSLFLASFDNEREVVVWLLLLRGRR